MTDIGDWASRDYAVAQARQHAFGEVEAASAALTFSAVSDPLASSALVLAFETAFESTAFVCFEIAGLDARLRRALKRIGQGGSGEADAYITRVLSCDAMRRELPELMTSLANEVPREGHGFDIEDALLLEGSLAMALRDGGPYSAVPAPQALDLAHRFRLDMFADRFDDIHVATGSDWSDWFSQMGWDHGWIITDLATARVRVLCASGDD